jgi:predicted GIY-YIG superfamily endonuclease
VEQHQAGQDPGCYTFRRRPVALVWSESFSSRIEAKEAEARIKGWSRAKKEALLRGEWDAVSLLARNWQV